MITQAAPHPNDIAERLIGRDYLSFSAVSTFQTCPLRFFFRYIQGLAEETVSASLVFGGAVHSSVEHHFNELMAGNPAPDHDTLLDVFWSAWHKREHGGEITFSKQHDINTMGRLADQVLTAFSTSEFAKPVGTIIGVEEELRGQISEDVPEILARIDLLVETDNELKVVDFKTARSRWSQGQAEQNAEQLLIYGQMARQLMPGKNLGLEFAVATKTKSPTVECFPVAADERRIERTVATVRHVWQAIETGNYFPAPSPMSCPSCPFRDPCLSWCG